MRGKTSPLVAGFSLVVALLAVSSPVPAYAKSVVTIPGGTPVVVRLTDDLTSATATQGDSFGFVVVDEIAVDGWVAIAAGAKGVGRIADVEAAGSNAHSGKISLTFDYIFAVDGEEIRLAQTDNAAEGQNNKGEATNANIASLVLLGPVGLFAHNFVDGRNVTITSKKPFTMFVDDTVRVVSNRRSLPGSFAH